MSWSLSAAGHAIEDAAGEVEKELQERLVAVLSDPKFGAYSSNLVGSVVNGAVHIASEVLGADKPAAENAPAAEPTPAVEEPAPAAE